MRPISGSARFELSLINVTKQGLAIVKIYQKPRYKAVIEQHQLQLILEFLVISIFHDQKFMSEHLYEY